MYIDAGQSVVLVMTKRDYQNLLLLLGAATMTRDREDWSGIDFINRLNEGNPHFTPIEIPEEFKTHATQP